MTRPTRRGGSGASSRTSYSAPLFSSSATNSRITQATPSPMRAKWTSRSMLPKPRIPAGLRRPAPSRTGRCTPRMLLPCSSRMSRMAAKLRPRTDGPLRELPNASPTTKQSCSGMLSRMTSWLSLTGRLTMPKLIRPSFSSAIVSGSSGSSPGFSPPDAPGGTTRDAAAGVLVQRIPRADLHFPRDELAHFRNFPSPRSRENGRPERRTCAALPPRTSA